MNKLVLILLSFFFVQFVNGQTAVCTPGAQVGVGQGYILPDSIVNLAHACPSNYYEQIIYIKAPRDTSFNFNGAVITARLDSFVVSSSITGLPSYLTVATKPQLHPAHTSNPNLNFPHLTIPGDSLACLKISGNVPSNATPNTTPLTFKIRAYLTQTTLGLTFDTSFSITHYKFTVDALGSSNCAPFSIRTSDAQLDAYVYPNPVDKGTLGVKYYLEKPENMTYRIIDIMGVEHYNYQTSTKAGFNDWHIPVDKLSAGIYILHLNSDTENYSTQVIIK